MKTLLKTAGGAALAAALLAAPAEAQQKAWGFGIHTGWTDNGRLAETDLQDRHLKLDNGWHVGGDLEWWFGSRRWGFRTEGTWMKQPFIIDREPDAANPTNPEVPEDEEQEVLQGFTGVNTIFADANLMLRLLEPTVDRRFAPFLSLGTGFIRWDYDSDRENDPREFEPVDAYIYGDSQTEWAVTGGIGADFFLSESVALRLEAKDYWHTDSPILKLSDMDRDHKGGHNFLYRAGLHFNFGGARVEEPGFVALPEPEPEPEPMPEPEPATERVTMCVVSPEGRLQTVQGTRYLESGEIYVTRNGQEVLFSTAYPVVEPYYVRGAPWYIANEPLMVALGTDDMGGDVDDELDDAVEDMEDLSDADRVEFVRFGTTGPLPMGEVLYVGSIDGTPLYATRSDIGSLLPELERRLSTTRDLDEVLEDEAFADRFVNEIETFYLAVEPGSAECIFQPVSSTRVIRRTNG